MKTAWQKVVEWGGRDGANLVIDVQLDHELSIWLVVLNVAETEEADTEYTPKQAADLCLVSWQPAVVLVSGEDDDVREPEVVVLPWRSLSALALTIDMFRAHLDENPWQCGPAVAKQLARCGLDWPESKGWTDLKVEQIREQMVKMAQNLKSALVLTQDKEGGAGC